MMRGGRSNRDDQESYRYPCLTMHKPWASLLVCGIKRIEGRSWPAPLTGRLWIHAASKVPDPTTIKAMENFYREIYALDGIKDLKFPEYYPLSRLIGCVDVVGCVTSEELSCWEEVPEGVRLEGLTNFCWLCEKPEKLIAPYEMRGYQGVFNLERKIYEAAVRDLCAEEGPTPIKFPLPNPRDPYSLKPGSLVSYFTGSKASKLEKPPNLIAVIAGARAAATQFSKRETKTVQFSRKEVKHHSNTVREGHTFDSSPRQHMENEFTEENKNASVTLPWRPQGRDPLHGGTHFSKIEVKNRSPTVQERHIFDSSPRHSDNKFTEEDKVSGLTLQRIPQERDLTQRATPFSRKEATTQFSDEGVQHETNTVQERHTYDPSLRRHSEKKYIEGNKKSTMSLQLKPEQRYSAQRATEYSRKDVITTHFHRKEAKTAQFSKKEVHQQTNIVQQRQNFDSTAKRQLDNRFADEDRKSTVNLQWRPLDRDSVHSYKEQYTHVKSEGNSSSYNQAPQQDLNERLGAPSKIFQAALKGLRPG